LHRGERRCNGFSLIEVAIATAVLGAVLLATAMAFTSTTRATDQARRTTDAAIFLEATLENVSGQPYENLLTLNGNTVFDETDADDSNYSVDIATFLAEVNLVQVTATLNDLETGRVIGRVNTLRANR